MVELLSALGLLGTVLFVLAGLRLWRACRGRGAGAAAPAGRFGVFQRLVLWCAVLSFLALALTGFAAGLKGEALAGYTLLFHVSCGGVLAAAFTVLLVMVAGRFGLEGAGSEGAEGGIVSRLGFWLLAAALIGLVLTTLTAMLPLAGTEGQRLLVHLHRLFALAAVALAVGLAWDAARRRARAA